MIVKLFMVVSVEAAAFGRREGYADSLSITYHAMHKLAQLSALRKGNAVMYSTHVTHHAGTAMCMAARLNTNAPPFLCTMSPPMLPEKAIPWARRHGYGYISAEFRGRVQNGWNWTLAEWERPDLVSVVVMRDPIDRLFTDDGMAIIEFGETMERDWKAWDRYARSDYTDNYALRVFGSVSERRPVTRKDLESAKAFLRRVTIIIDQACFSSTLRELFGQIGWKKLSGNGFKLRRSSKIKHHAGANMDSNRARIRNDTIYEKLVSRNSLDIELYRWSKIRSWKVC